MSRPRLLLSIVAVGIALLLVPGASAASGHYVPRAGDTFSYSEVIAVGSGVGNYSGYTEDSHYTGSIHITAVLPNGTESATYASSGTYSNNLGQSYPWSQSGSFTFSAATYHYVQGTDNLSGYVDPYVWFYVNSTLTQGATAYVLNTPMSVVSTNFSYPMATSSTGYVASLFLEGNGSYQRDDVYGKFTASYNYKAYFDPATGYSLGYVYAENDNDGVGDGFSYTDTVVDTSTSFPLTQAAAPPSTPSPNWNLAYAVVGGIVLLVVVVIAIVVVVAVRRARRRPAALPRHATPTLSAEVPLYAPPPSIDVVPGNQPTPQVVLRETVKVPCRYCGTLMDSTATNCPKCGAPRT